MFKTPFFGAIIALVGCHFGMTTRGGTEGVGNSTTRTVVVVSITILIADFFLTKISIAMMPGL
jgi:phospholipid/cholesterol/gamma-HCH transport system permease protein